MKLFRNDGKTVRIEQGPYYKQFKLYLQIFRLFGRVPYETNLSGELQMRYFSQIAFYSIVVFSIQLYSIYLVFLWQIPRIQHDGSFDNVISSVLVLLCLNFHYDILLHSWWEAQTVVDYYESWKKYNSKYVKDIGSPVPSRLSTKITTFIVSSAVIFIVVIIFESKYLLKDLAWYLCWPLFSVAYNVTLLSSFFFFNCLMICYTVEELNNQLVEVLNYNPYRHQVSKYRCLILQLRTLTTQFGNVTSRTVAAASFTLVLVVVLASYGVVAITLQGDFDKLLSIIIPFMFGSTNFCIYCEGAYRLSDKIKYGTVKTILECNLVSLRSEVHQEVELLLDTIKTISGDIEPLGVFVMNRRTLVQVFGVTISYLIVLAQFRVTDKLSSS